MSIFTSCSILNPQELEITEAEDATAIVDKIRSKQWSAVQVTVAFCKRAAIAQQLVNCLMDIDFEGGIKRAKELDHHLASTGQVIGSLHGLPVSLKDLTDVKNMKITLGLTALADKVSEEDAVCVKSLRAAGAIVYCRTTMPITGMALETASNLYGRTLNLFNASLVSGGSSGGEGAPNGCLGAPVRIATDIGGSIRAPAAFNGLYGIRPTSRRFSYKGNAMGFTGQMAILSTIDPVGRSLRDLELILRVWNASEPWLEDPAVMAKRWERVPTPEKTTIGLMWWDEVVMPHPPMQRTLKEAVDRLGAKGHEVVDFKPYKHKEAWDFAFKLYYPTGGKFVKDLLTDAGEPAIPAVEKFLAQAKELDCHELNALYQRQRQYQTEYLAHWNTTSSQTSNGRPVDAVLMPSFASASYPHDFLPWWGYLSQWNLLDYPAIILPVSKVKMSDIKDESYRPVNDLDQEAYDQYDPHVFEGAPVSLQLVGRSMFEEQLMAVATAVDQALRQ